MPPTVQSSSKDRDRKRPGDKRSELVCTVKYNNTLPDIPFDPKFITYPFESTRFIQYKPTSLERTFKYDLLTEHDLGVTIDLINPDTYKINPNALLEPEDEKLLDEESTSFGDQKRSRHNKMNVSWLRKTEYISTEYNRFAQKADKSETKVGFMIKKGISEDYFYKDRESQINAIEKTFEKAKEPITKHYSKPGVHPVEILPVYPDYELWKHPFAQVIFDSDPAPKGRTGPALMDEMSQAMIRGAVDESGEQFVAYFLPTEETRKKRKRDEDEHEDYQKNDEYDYTLAREYNWTVKNKLTRGYEETYFMVFREDGCYYDELETRVRLSKRRKGAGTAVVKSRLVVKHRGVVVEVGQEAAAKAGADRAAEVEAAAGAKVAAEVCQGLHPEVAVEAEVRAGVLVEAKAGVGAEVYLGQGQEAGARAAAGRLVDLGQGLRAGALVRQVEARQKTEARKMRRRSLVQVTRTVIRSVG